MNEPVCKFFKRNGYCPFMNKCWYSHSSEPTSKNLNYSNYQAAGETTSESEARLHEIGSHKRTDTQRNIPFNPSYKRYARKNINVRNNFRPNPVRSSKQFNQIEFSKERAQKQINESSANNKQSTSEITGNFNRENAAVKETESQTRPDRIGVPVGTRRNTSFTNERRTLQGKGRWNSYKGPRFFYGNFRRKPIEQRVKTHDNGQNQTLGQGQSGAKQENLFQNQANLESASQTSTDNNAKNVFGLYRPYTAVGRFQMKTSELSMDEFSRLLATEIQQLKKRFPNHQLIKEDADNEGYCIEYFPTDPDWPFQVSSLKLQLIFPPEYPKIIFSASVVDEKDCLPELLIKHLNKTIQNWLSEKQERNENNGITELLFRPFLKWLDKNLENMFLSGLRLVKQEVDAKAAGIEFVPYENLCNSLKTAELSASSNVSVEPNDLPDSNSKYMDQGGILNNVTLSDRTPATVYLKGSDLADQNSKTSNISHSNEDVTEGIQHLSLSDIEPSDKSKERIQNIAGLRTEVKFKSLYLSENAGTLVCEKVQLTIQCARCKTRHDLATLAHKLSCAACTKCHEMQEIFFQPTMLHPNSSVLGYLHLAQCKIIDLPLVSCEFLIGCLNCTKQCSLTGVHYDQQRVTWCHYCNSKMAVVIQGVRFLEIHSSGLTNKLQAHTVRLESKVIKNTAIVVQPGKPLPDNGTCKHYKKSYRWLRFPCCGKAYPCDLCHDEKEGDHEMKLASRMICGFCAKEQPYSKDKECVSCGSFTTKKSGIHWEGGKGCRDRNKMSKGDKHKYSGANKTKSLKKVGLNVKKGDAVQ